MAYRRYGAEVGASVTLPAGLTGELVWRGQTYTLASGAQELKLPARWAGRCRAAGDGSIPLRVGFRTRPDPPAGEASVRPLRRA